MAPDIGYAGMIHEVRDIIKPYNGSIKGRPGRRAALYAAADIY
jgi:hypothetical protein